MTSIPINGELAYYRLRGTHVSISLSLPPFLLPTLSLSLSPTDSVISLINDKVQIMSIMTDQVPNDTCVVASATRPCIRVSLRLRRSNTLELMFGIWRETVSRCRVVLKTRS